MIEHKWFTFVRIKDPSLKSRISSIVEYATFHLYNYTKPPIKILPPAPGKSVDKKDFDYAGLKNIRKDEIGLPYNCWGYYDIPIKVVFKKELA
eukprot:CAMPEP_0170496450 /NCGR_PEP_ID=MMETSP0208-20121228/21633_1 /TAXON_ID=197538 /ORGANISM="Strombidium inclinatum, Strain S3" /LENGTH=92 /DNA_ID=CAMNT_0010773001 /DNA_START=385 /DNA_END=663 /DNA_ORIENTATION=+